jgi:hypothetical protein
MNIKTDRNRALAFAGMLQALHLVQQTAHWAVSWRWTPRPSRVFTAVSKVCASG